MKKFLALAGVAATLAASPVVASETLTSSSHVKDAPVQDVVGPCDVNLPVPGATSCAGYFSGNVLNGSSTDVQNQIAALAELGYTFNGDWSSVEPTRVLTLQNGNQIDFGTMLYGLTIIGAHFGNVAGPAGNVSVFWAFDFGEEGAQYVTLSDAQGFSNAILYSTGVPAVPEPSTWLMLLLGFAGIGFSLRRKKSIVGKPAVA